MHIGSSHNRAAMPFDARVGNEMTYQAAKPANWQPGITKYKSSKEISFAICLF